MDYSSEISEIHKNLTDISMQTMGKTSFFNDPMNASEIDFVSDIVANLIELNNSDLSGLSEEEELEIKSNLMNEENIQDMKRCFSDCLNSFTEGIPRNTARPHIEKAEALFDGILEEIKGKLGISHSPKKR